MIDYAVIRIGSRQFKVNSGSDLLIPFREDAVIGSQVTFDQVLIMVQEGSARFGNPALSGVVIKGTVVGQEKGTKLKISKYKAKSRYQKETGFRPKYTRIKVADFSGKKVVSEDKPVVKNIKTVRKTSPRTKRK